ncbi:hypothetical protein [Maribellus sediminis]|uniref:hypothetical protein n=1 Tax=Maribellus sediminis TaxID=2696285 RepID=UPI00142FD398|nr:hypothetical protein [Maribellus sediminis]
MFAVQPALAQENQQSSTHVRISNVNIYYGKTETPHKGKDVLVDGYKQTLVILIND